MPSVANQVASIVSFRVFEENFAPPATPGRYLEPRDRDDAEEDGKKELANRKHAS